MIRRIMLLLAAVALLSFSLAPVVLAQAGAPEDVDETPFVLKKRAVFGNCSISELMVDRDGAHILGAWNQLDHLAGQC